MRVPVEWLKEYTDINISNDGELKDFCDKLIMSGSNIETVEKFGENFKKVVVGKVVTKEKHPDADKLSVCKVDVGQEEPIQIVCGATNVAEGIMVPVALHKSRVPGPLHGEIKKDGGVEITKGKLRGITSMGMICAASELGFMDKVIPTSHKDGIWVSPQSLEVGRAYEEAMELKDSVIEFEITPNRADCLSMIGMAREVAATMCTKLEYPKIEIKEEGGSKTEDLVCVEIMNPELCNRYVARVVTDIEIKESPWWLQRRLMYAGIRPINNIVDITNYVMLEQGNPIHAFDLKKIEENKIVVGVATEGEEFTTLDGKRRNLSEDMLLIRDGKKPVAIAGIMGGSDSEIRPDTKSILIEVANFNSDSIRGTSKKLGLRTEASARYEKGVDPNLCKVVADRVCQLIEEIGAGKVQKGMVDIYPSEKKPCTVPVRVERVNKLLGTEISAEEMTRIFTSLEMEVTSQAGILKVTPPTIRADLTREEDFVEEVARIYGYDKLPMTLPKGNQESDMGRQETLRRVARDAMCAMGANEIQTYSFVSPLELDKIKIGEDYWERSFVELINPLGEENSIMRTLLTPAMLTTLGHNFARGVDKVQAFEIGTTFGKKMLEEKGLPEERDSMVIGLYGKDIDFYTLKGMVVELLGSLGIKDIIFEKETEYGPYHPGRCARIAVQGAKLDESIKERLLEDAKRKIEGTEEELELMREMVAYMAKSMEGGTIELGIMGEIHPDVASNYGIDTRCYCCELMFTTAGEFAHTNIQYKPLAKYPSSARDIALVVDEAVQVGDIMNTIKLVGGERVEEVQLFDIYRGEQVERGKKSVAFRITYRDANMTLTDEEILPTHNGVLEALQSNFAGVLREPGGK